MKPLGALVSERRSENGQRPLADLAVPLDIIDRVRSAYEGRRVLVTGGMSFIGSHLVELLSPQALTPLWPMI